MAATSHGHFLILCGLQLDIEIQEADDRIGLRVRHDYYHSFRMLWDLNSLARLKVLGKSFRPAGVPVRISAAPAPDGQTTVHSRFQ